MNADIIKILDDLNLIYKRSQSIKNLYNELDKKIRVLILGGGPVGLFTAVRFLSYGIDVKILELRAEYTREEVFMLQENPMTFTSLQYMPKDLLDELLNKGCIIDLPPLDINPICFKGYDETNTVIGTKQYGVKMSEFEKILADYLKRKGVNIIKPTTGKANITIDKTNWIVNYDSNDGNVRTFTPSDYDIIVGAEGTKSEVKNTLLEDAKNPLNPIEGIKHIFLVNKKDYPDKNDVIIKLGVNDNQISEFKTPDGNHIGWYISSDLNQHDKFEIGYGLVCIIKPTDEMKKRIVDTKLRDPSQLTKKQDPSQFTKNPQTEFYNNTNIPSHVNPSGTSPQHRYRFFISREGNWYFGINLSKKEKDIINSLSRGKNFKMDPKKTILKSKELYFAMISMLGFYGITTNFDEAKKILYDNLVYATIFPISIYKTNYYMSSKKIDNKRKICAIVGDACLGVHYFSGSGVNAGITAANELVESLGAYINLNYDKTDLFEGESFEDLLKKFNNKISNLNDKTLVSSLTVDLDLDLLERQAEQLNIDKKKVKCPQNDDSFKCNIRNNYINLLFSSENKVLDNTIIDKQTTDTELLKVIQPNPKKI